MSSEKNNPDLTGYEIVHELPERLRIRCAAFRKPSLDPVYIEAVLENIRGVTHARVNMHIFCAIIKYDGQPETRRSVLSNLVNLPDESFEPGSNLKQKSDKLTLATIASLTLLSTIIPKPFRMILSVAMALPILFRGVLTLIFNGLKVEVLDGAVVFFSLVRRDYITSNIIVFLLGLGDYLEQLTQDRSSNLLKRLLSPVVEQVWIKRDGQEIAVLADDVKTGDTVVCGSGEIVPVDGRVTSGRALVNQASITGEALPVKVSYGCNIISGSLVEEGTVEIAAENVGRYTSTARISRFIETSLRSKSPSQQTSEALADQLVPLTFAIGLGAYFVTRDVSRAASVLTVDYSCSIKLSNPVTVKTAMFSAARDGVLLRGAQALDSLASLDTLVFDKTGTLTKGLLNVVDVISLGTMNGNEILRIAAAAEEHYKHPVAQSVVKAAREKKLDMPAASQVDFIVAHGVSAYVNGTRVLVGSRHFIEEDEKIDCSKLESTDIEVSGFGKSLLYVAIDGTVQGVIVLDDELRPEAPACIKALKATGIKKVVILTGDNHYAAEALLKKLNVVDEIHCELKPEEKASVIKSLQSKGHKVGFIGDGVNDAPALVTADVGICFFEGSDLARESAQVILVESNLNLLLYARNASIKTRRILKNGFKATVGFNSLFLFLALMGNINPVTAALLHNLTTVSVVGYSAGAGLSRSLLYNGSIQGKNNNDST